MTATLPEMINAEVDKHHIHTFFQRPDCLKAPLYVVTVVFNPIRFRSRWKLYQDFALMVHRAGAILYTAEIQFGDREFCLTEPDNPRHLRLHTDTEVWLKENATNELMKRLPLDWEYVAWIDSDVAFARQDWANETLHQLQHYKMVQMWSMAQDLDPNHQVVMEHKSFAYCYAHNVQLPQKCGDYYYGEGGKIIYWHPGYAWAARREAIDALGGLIDFAILGSADHHMAHALIGNIEHTLGQPTHERFKFYMRRWQKWAEEGIKRNIGYVPGLVLHYWHGSKESRRYLSRWKILVETQFNPDEHLRRDWQGLWQLVTSAPHAIELRDRLRAYFRQRDEDSSIAPTEWVGSMHMRENDRKD